MSDERPIRQTGVVETIGALAAAVWAGSWVAFVVVWLALYLLGCFIWPRRICPRCGKDKYRHDGRGNLRDRRCRRCGGDGDIRRLGSYVFGWGSREDADA